MYSCFVLRLSAFGTAWQPNPFQVDNEKNFRSLEAMPGRENAKGGERPRGGHRVKRDWYCKYLNRFQWCWAGCTPGHIICHKCDRGIPLCHHHCGGHPPYNERRSGFPAPKSRASSSAASSSNEQRTAPLTSVEEAAASFQTSLKYLTTHIRMTPSQYRRLALTFHPDKTPHPVLFNAFNEGTKCLTTRRPDFVQQDPMA